MMRATLKGKYLRFDLSAEAVAERQERTASQCPIDGRYSQRKTRLLDLSAEAEAERQERIASTCPNDDSYSQRKTFTA